MIPNEDYTLFLIACTPDGLPKTGDKLNVKKDPVKTLEATPTNAVYSMKVYNVTKTAASVSVSGNTAAEGQTYMFNYITKARLIELATKEEEATGGSTGSEGGNTGSEGGSTGEGTEGGEVTPIVPSEASFQTVLKRDCDEFIDASLKAWNDRKPNAQMDRKEFLSRSLLSDVGVGTSYSWDGLTPGTEYVAYAIGLKADGTYTTKAYATEFKTIEDIQSQIRLDVGMKAWVYEEYYPNKTNYTVAATGEPYNQVQGVYCKSFIENDEWAEKTGAEIEELLKKEPVGLGSASAPLTVERGKTFFVYFIGLDKEGISTHVSKVTHTSRVEGGDNGMAKTVKIDKLETIPVR